MIDRREAIKRVLCGERSDRLPRALFGGGLWSYRQTGLNIEALHKDPVSSAETLSGLFGDLDTDIVFAGSGLNSFPAEAIGGTLAFKENQAPLLSFPLIQKTDDARYLKKPDITNSPHTLGLIEMIAALRKLLPDRFLCITSWGPFTWAMILCEWNLLQNKTITDRAFIQEICDLGVRLSISLLEPLVERGLVDGITIPDGAVTLISTELYQEVVVPSEKKIFDWAREHGIKSFLHQCGKIQPQLALYPETGADCISVDAGVSISEAYDLYSKKLVTAGNIDVINKIFGGDPSLICNEVSECVRQVSDPFMRYILMPSCDLPSETPLLNVKEFLACADRIKQEHNRLI